MKRLLWILFGIMIVLVIGVVAVGIALQPPILVVPDQGVSLTDVTIINPGLDRREEQTLVAQGNTITRISKISKISGQADAAAAEAQRFAGMYVLPGLIDMHVHFGAELDRYPFGLLFLAYGVTTVRDTGNFDGKIWNTRQEIVDGVFPGPRIFACGPILDGDPPVWPGSRIVRNDVEATTAVAELAAQGVDCVKVYQRLSLQALSAIQAAAAQHGLPVVGHVPGTVPFEVARLADVQHLTGVPVWPENSSASLAGQLAAAWQELGNDRIAMLVQTSQEFSIAHTPILVVWERHARLLDPQQQGGSVAQLLPRHYRDVIWSLEEGFPYMRHPAAEDLIALGHEIQTMQRFVLRLHQAGVPIYVGSDTPNPYVVPGVSLHEEMQLWVDAGLTPEEVWVAATRQAGAFFKEPLLGILQEGAPADLLVFRDDPTQDLAALITLEAVVAQGRLYPKETLEEAVAQNQIHFESLIYDTLMPTFLRWWMQGNFGSE